MKKIYLASFLVVLSFGVVSAQADIAAARQAPLNSTVTVRGVVTNGSELGTIRYLQDTSAGIAVYDAALSSVQRGDSIVVTGTLTDYNNLLEIQPATSHTTFASANGVPAPQVIAPSQMGEALEGVLVRINNCVFANGGSPWAANSSYNFTSSSQQGIVYVHTGSPLIGLTIPTGPVDVIGILSQFSSQYQLLPRDSADIISNGSIVITTPVAQTNITQTGFDLNWTTNITGSTYIKYGKTPALELGVINGSAGISHTVSVPGNPADIFYAKAYSVNGTDTAYSAIRAYATVSASSGSIKVYFDKSVDTTFSTGTNAIMLFHTIDDTIIAYINRAQYTIDVAIYSFDNANISNISTALNNAWNRGVKVRIISDGGNTNPALAQLNASIPRIASPTTSAYGIMHNKFMIIDANSNNPMDPVLWTGSTNWTDNQTGTDANNVIIFQDQSIARGYTIEFNEMWGDTGMTANLVNSKFGPYKIDNTPHEYIIGGKRVEQYFSPSDGTNAKIYNALMTANTDLCIATMQITRSDLAYGITGQSQAGVQTYVLVDDSSTTTTWSILSSGLPAGHLVYYHATGIMHHKYMVVDRSNPASDPMVETGSHNWTTSAETKNDENIVIVHDAVIANIYYQEFHPRFTQSGGVIMGVPVFEQNMNDLSVYPNPSQDHCLVQFSATHNENFTVTVTDITGKTVSSQQFAAQQGTNTIQWNSAGLPAGIYMMTLTGVDCNGVVKIVVQ